MKDTLCNDLYAIGYMLLRKSFVLQRYVFGISLKMISNLLRPHLRLRQICKAIVWCCMHVQKLGIAWQEVLR